MTRECLYCTEKPWPKSKICRPCKAWLEALGVAWCCRGHEAEQVHKNGLCPTCDRKRQRKFHPPRGWITPPEAARRLCVSEQTIRYWIARGWRVNRKRFGRVWYIRPTDVVRIPYRDKRVRR